MVKNTHFSALLLLAFSLGLTSNPVYSGPDVPTQFTNIGGIANTRHNMTQNGEFVNNNGDTMDSFRNDYAAVCVYCHTPHGANETVEAPLWNRTMPNNSYTTYDTLGTSSLTSNIVQPGINSLTCLSCHDGTLAVDSVINMPGSGGYDKNVERANDETDLVAWLDTWGSQMGGNTPLNGHFTLDENPSSGTSCLSCHSRGPVGDLFPGATDFTLFAIGTNLTNDHPVGVELPNNGPGTDFNAPSGIRASIQWYDGDADNRPDSDEIRFYNTGSGPRVECASCHDPHGVAPGGFGTPINKSFLRVSNANSTVCMTCHVK